MYGLIKLWILKRGTNFIVTNYLKITLVISKISVYLIWKEIIIVMYPLILHRTAYMAVYIYKYVKILW